ncbi:MAG TPA: hypothetical protein VH595_22890 [Verrucomicrobiae bacterium]|nr:hypothetical protein [Verrucomicrobiae bacterium]
MFDLEKAVTEWRRHMIAGGLTNSDTLDELESHLRDDVNRRIRAGVAPRDAFESAVQEIGPGSSPPGGIRQCDRSRDPPSPKAQSRVSLFDRRGVSRSVCVGHLSSLPAMECH